MYTQNLKNYIIMNIIYSAHVWEGIEVIGDGIQGIVGEGQWKRIEGSGGGDRWDAGGDRRHGEGDRGDGGRK